MSAPFFLFALISSLLIPPAFAQDSLRATCEAASRMGALEILKGNTTLTDRMRDGNWSELPTEVAKGCDTTPRAPYCGDNLGLVVWTSHMFPEPAAGKFAYDLQTTRVATRFHAYLVQEQGKTGLTRAGEKWDLPSDPTFEKVLRDAPLIRNYSPKEIAWTRNAIADLRSRGGEFDDEIAQITGKAPLVCAVHGTIASARGCTLALRELANRMHPYSIGRFAYSLVDLLEELLTDPLYARVLPKLALRLDARIQKGGETAEGAYFSDVFEAFRDEGLSPSSATEYTWKWMAIYSTRGSSFPNLFRILHDRQLALGYAVLGIASGASALDQLRYPAPAYTFPKSYRSSCFYGKPYHFWMSAYFTRKLRLEGYSEDAATLASYLTGTLYEFGSKTMGRSPERSLLEPIDSEYNRWVKTNLFFDAWGARFGRDSLRFPRPSEAIPTDDSLGEFLADHVATEDLPDSLELRLLKHDATKYLLWIEKFQPYSYLRSVLD